MRVREILAALLDIWLTVLSAVVGVMAVVTWSKHGFDAAIPRMSLSMLFWVASEQLSEHWGIGHW